jgi:hypothetical protein
MSINITTLLAWAFGSIISVGMAATFFDQASGDSPGD